jgi:hypothetical protein
MKAIRDWEDAKHSMDLVLVLRHTKQLQPRCPGLCIGHWAWMEHPNVVDAHVFLECTYVKFKSGKIIKWANSRRMREIAELNDLRTKAEVIAHFKKILDGGNAIVARLNPPIGVRSKSYLRSEEHREMKRESAEKSTRLRKNGVPARRYTSPAAKGLRQGNGLAHTWD